MRRLEDITHELLIGLFFVSLGVGASVFWYGISAFGRLLEGAR